MKIIIYIFLISFSILCSHAILCPNPLDSGLFLGGTCDLQLNTTLTNSISNVNLDMNSTTIDCKFQSGLLGVSNPNVIISNGKFINCQSKPDMGGIFYFESSVISFIADNIEFFNCSTANNRGIFVSNTTIITLNNCKFDSIKTDNGIISDSSTIYVYNSTFTSLISISGSALHVRDGIYIYDSNFTNCDTKFGVVYINSGTNNSIIKSNFVNCKGYNGGVIYIGLGLNNINIDNSNFINCTSELFAGVLYSYSINNIINVSNSQFINCNSTYVGAIYSNSKLNIINSSMYNVYDINIVGCIFVLDSLNVINSNFTNCRSSVTGVISGKTNVNIINSNFIGNKGEYSVLSMQTSISDGSQINIIGSNIINNSGVVLYDIGNRNINIICTYIAHNMDDEFILYSNNGTLYLTNSSFVDNNASNNASNNGKLIYSNSVNVDNCYCNKLCSVFSINNNILYNISSSNNLICIDNSSNSDSSNSDSSNNDSSNNDSSNSDSSNSDSSNIIYTTIDSTSEVTNIIPSIVTTTSNIVESNNDYNSLSLGIRISLF